MTESAQSAAQGAAQKSPPAILQTRRDAVVTITLNRPERLNALDHALARGLLEALNQAAEDKTVRAVVLTGSGRGFCAGGDLLRAA